MRRHEEDAGHEDGVVNETMLHMYDYVNDLNLACRIL